MLFCIKSLSAQEKNLTGRVINQKSEAIPFASIQLKGTKRGVSADNNGLFLIKFNKPGDVLVVSSVGYSEKEITIGNEKNIEITLVSNGDLADVVVTTAFGFKQKKKSLGYTVQEVTSADLEKGRENNFINALQGKVSGVNITPSGGAPGAGSDILIRGITSINPGANNQPLIVIDGLPVNNNTIVGNMLPSSGTNNLQAASRDQFAYANRGLDINPDDIESLSVLKGAGATALYGLGASNGVIVITTKKGAAGKMLMNFNSSIAYDKITKYPEIQTKYREGQQGRLAFNSDGSPNRFQTFGPLATANDPIYYNYRDAFDIGSRLNNSLTIQGGNAKTTYFSSVSSLNQKGVLPFSSFDRLTFKLAGTQQVSDKLKLTASATLTNSKNTAGSQGDKGFMTALSYYSPTFNVWDYLNTDGSMKVFSPGIIDNPIYVAQFSQMKSNLFRFVGNMGLSYKITPRLKFDYQIGSDMYSDSRTRILPGPRFPGDPSTLDMAYGQGGFIVEERITFRDITSNAFITYELPINNNLELTTLIGNTIQNTYSDIINARGEKFALPGFYDLSNTSNLYNSRFTTRRKYAGVFGDIKLGYKNALYLQLTARNDWSSTLPTSNNSFLYPSASLSYIFTDLHNLKSDILSFGKLRFSYAQVGKDAPVYSNGPYYNLAAGFPFGSIPGFVRGTDFADPKLKPEMQKSYEIGTEFRFFNNKLGIDISAYQSTNVDQIIPVPIAYTSGYSSFVTNAGSIRNRGLEIELTATPYKKKDFTWDIALNWSANRSKVISIKEGINEVMFYDEGRIANKLVVNGSAGDLYGIVYKRNEAGKLVMRADGYPDVVSTSVYSKAGNSMPDWIGSLNNSFRYKNFSLSALLEFKKGGDVFDVTMRNSIRNGILKITEQRYVNVIFDGVKADGGTPNDASVLIDHNYYRNANFFNNIADVILQDASWLRLRNVVLGYDLPANILKKASFIKSANLNVTLNNIILWTPFKGYDPGTSSFGSGFNVYGYTGSNIPNYSSLIMGLNVKF